MTDRHLAGASADGPPVGTTRKCAILSASIIHSTASPTSSLDLLPEGYDPRYDVRHEHNGHENQVQ